MRDKANPITGGLLQHFIKVVNQDSALYITATQVKELDSLYQVQYGVSIKPYLVASLPVLNKMMCPNQFLLA